VVRYDADRLALPSSRLPLEERIRTIAESHLPLLGSTAIGLEIGPRPLVAMKCGGVFVKAEYLGISGSHKDRFHEVSTKSALLMGAERVVTVSTGNHGASCAAFAARAGLRCLVFLHPESPPALRTQIAAYGSDIAVLREPAVPFVELLVDDGWFPATGTDPGIVGRANPYGQEGYRRIAYELVAELGHMPEVISVPAGSGDTLFGIWRALRDMHELLDLPMPFLIGGQPAGAAPLVRTQENPADGPRAVGDPKSVALSTREARSGWHASVALRQDGAAVDVSEAAIGDALGALARDGQFVEPASAISLAALQQARERGLVDGDAEAVCIATSSGQNWTLHIDELGGPPEVIDNTADLVALVGPCSSPRSATGIT
jgi:threonine synthase